MNSRILLSVMLLSLMAITMVQAQHVKVMTYNIRFDNPQDGANAWDARKEHVAEQLMFYQPAVFGIQEGLHHQVEYLDEALPPYQYEGVGRDDGKTGGEYSAIFYDNRRFSLLRSNTFWLSDTPEEPSVGWDAAMERICTYVLLEDREHQQPLWVFNTHFDHVGEQARYQSAQLILKKIDAVNKNGYPVVLMGDLNAEPGDPPIDTLNDRMEDAYEVTEKPPFGPEGTYNGFHFDRPVKRRIDYIFVRGAAVARYGVLSDPENLHYPSDHFPVMAEIRIQAWESSSIE